MVGKFHLKSMRCEGAKRAHFPSDPRRGIDLARDVDCISAA